MPELELLRRIAPPTETPSADAYVRARAALLERMEQVERPRMPRVRRRWLLPAAGLAATGAVVATVFLSVGAGGEDAASAAGVLREAAAAARAQQPPPALLPDQYLYTRSTNAYLATTVSANGGGYSVIEPHEREIWVGPDGTGWLHQTSGESAFLSARDRQTWIDAGSPPFGPDTMNLPLENDDAPDVPMQSLGFPSDPDALWDRLEADAQGHGSGLYQQMFTLVGDALRESFTTPEQRAALYEVAARLPGVELVGETTDPAGRPGIAVAMEDGTSRIRYVLIFDPDTAALLGEVQTLLEGNWGGYPAGTVIGRTAYLESAVVDEIRVRPDGSSVSAESTDLGGGVKAGG